MEIISRAVALRATLKNWIHFTAERWVRLKTPAQLIEDMEQGLDQALTDFANTKRYHVIFTDQPQHQRTYDHDDPHTPQND